MSDSEHDQQAFAAELLRRGSSAFAAMSADKLLSSVPDIGARYARPSMHWREHMAARVRSLAAAVGAGRPTMFVHQCHWDKVAYSARGGVDAAADIERSLSSLRDVVKDELPPNAAGPALACLDAAIAGFASAPTRAPAALMPNSPLGRLAMEYLLAILEGDRHRACMLIMDAVQRGHGDRGPVPIPEIYLQVLTPVQQEIGRMWHIDEISVAEEHFATSTTRTVISMLYPHLPRRAPNGKVALCASVEGNAHDIGVRMVADFLEMDGWRTIDLGQNLPSEDTAQAVSDFGVDLVALSASLPTHLPMVEATIGKLRASEMGEDVKIMVGGAAFLHDPDVWRLSGADGYARTVVDAVAIAARLVGL